MEPKNNLHLADLSIAGEWTARDFTRVFGLLDEANSLFTVLHLGRATIVDAAPGRSAYLRRVNRKNDPQVVVEGVQFGSPGNISAWFPWKEAVEFLLRLFSPKSPVDRALQEEQLKQARARTEAIELDNERRRVAIERERTALAAERLDLLEASEQAAFDYLWERFGEGNLMGLIVEFHSKSGAPYAVIAEYFRPRMETISSTLQDLQQRGLLRDISAVNPQLPLPGPEGDASSAGGRP
jgi:hypothetical protein